MSDDDVKVAVLLRMGESDRVGAGQVGIWLRDAMILLGTTGETAPARLRRLLDEMVRDGFLRSSYSGVDRCVVYRRAV